MNTCNINIRKVASRKEIKDFARFANRLYRDCPQYVPEMESEIKSSLHSPTEEAETQAFMAYRDGKPVGRVLAINSQKANKKWNIRAVRFSMLDFIDDPAVSEALLHTVEEWGVMRGLDTIQGPLGLTDFDKEGMLVEDFNLMGTMSTLYNYSYYPVHMDRLGFTKAADWLQLRATLPDRLPERYLKTAKLTSQLFHLKLNILSRREILHQGWGYKVFQLFNTAYAPLFGFTNISEAQTRDFISKYLPLTDPRMVPVVTNEEGEVVCAAVAMGSLSNAMRRAHGRMLPFGWFHLLKALKFKYEDLAELLLIGVRPDYQGSGVSSLVFTHLYSTLRQLGFKIAETGPQLETNTKELSQWKYLDAKYVKRRRCYTKAISTTANEN